MDGKIRIMLAEDDPHMMKVMGDAFDGRKYDVVREENGSEALNRLLEEDFHVAVLDDQMPGTGGINICKRLREENRKKSLPIILLTATTDPAERIDGYRSGADACLSKPVNNQEMVGIIENLCRQRYDSEFILSNMKGFGGTVSSFPVVDLLQFMEMGAKTGSLEIKSFEKSAVVYFDKGVIVHSESGRLRGSNAIYHIISWQDGTFVYSPDKMPAEVTVRENLSHLLLEGIRLMDEEARDNTAVKELTQALLQVETSTESKVLKKMEDLSKKIALGEKRIFEILVIDIWKDSRKEMLDFFISSILKYIGRDVQVSKKDSAISSFAKLDVMKDFSIDIVVSSGKRKFNLLWQVFLEQANALVVFVDPTNEEARNDGIEIARRFNSYRSQIPCVIISPVGQKAAGLPFENPKWFAVPEYNLINLEEIFQFMFDFTQEHFLDEIEMRR
ncbi:response regulator [candidate division WOR-3 bacterium]|nr:response regulator [candidate division WOR-3 bacterium]